MFFAMAAALGVMAAAMWLAEHFPDVDIGKLFQQDNIAFDRRDGGPGEWGYEPNNPRASERSGIYDRQITGTDGGIVYRVPGDNGDVRFDGWSRERDVLLEAKGPGYGNFVDDDYNLKPWAKHWDDELTKQLERQAAAAQGAGKKVEWHVAEENAAKAIEKRAKQLGLDDTIEVKHTPPTGG